MNAMTSSFVTWKATLNNLLATRLGVGLEDFPEHDFLTDFAAGVTPHQSFTGLHRNLEVRAMFAEASEAGRALFAPHVLEEAGLDYRAGEWLDEDGADAEDDAALLAYAEFQAATPGRASW